MPSFGSFFSPSPFHVPRNPRTWTLTPVLTLPLKQRPFLIVVAVVRGCPAAAAASIPHPDNRGPSPPFPACPFPPGQLTKACLLPTSPPYPTGSHRGGLRSWVGPWVSPQLPGVLRAHHL